MSIREMTEKTERETLSSMATLSTMSKGRKLFEEECELRTAFQRDRDRIIHSNSFRRLKHKTQVFLAPQGDHYRTRLTHTLEVSQIARTIANTIRSTAVLELGTTQTNTPIRAIPIYSNHLIFMHLNAIQISTITR